MRIVACLACAVLCSTLPAQQIIERFDYPDGKVPNWTAQSGSWSIKNKQLVHTYARAWEYITIDLVKNVRDCVLDVDTFYGPTVTTQSAGVCARHPGGPGENGLVMTKIQDNKSAGNFNRTFLYERPGSSVYLDTPPTTAATVRMIVKGNQAWFLIDGNQDGVWDQVSAVKTFTQSTTQPQGLVGIHGFAGPIFDNWKYFDAILMADPASGNRPKIGTTFSMVLSAPLRNGNLPTPWLAMASLGNAGIPLPDGRALPLTFDVLLANSFGFGWNGLLTTQNPEAKLALQIPNDSVLVGLRLYASAVTIGGTGSFGFAAISNDHQIIIEQ